jgi:hypothetical protein
MGGICNKIVQADDMTGIRDRIKALSKFNKLTKYYLFYFN